MNQKNQKGFRKPLRILYALFIITVSIFSISPLSSVYGQTYQVDQTSVYTRITSNLGGYMASLPNDYSTNTSQKYPLLISLSGIGERGNGSAGVLEKVTNVGIAGRIKSKTFPASFTVGGKSYSFIVISPMMADASSPNWAEDVNALIAHCKSKYRVDANRIYLAGLSLGGQAIWYYAIKYGSQMAAGVMVAPNAYSNASSLKAISDFQVPLWVTHNKGDGSYSYTAAVNLVNAINAYVPAPPKALLTVFDNSGHDAWSKTYDPAFKQNGMNIYEWMLSNARGTVQATPAPPTITANGGADKIITLPTNTVTLDASASKVSSGTIASYTWTKVSGPSGDVITPVSNGLQAKITGLVAGTYKYQLTVKSSYGNTASVTVTVTVNANTSLQPPTAVITGGGTGTITLPDDAVYLQATSSKASTGGAIVGYQWSYVSGPSGFRLLSPTASTTYIDHLVAGTYVFGLKLTDASGLTSSATKTIVVKPATSARTASGETVSLAESNTINSDELTSELNFKVSPNPVQSDMNIALNGAAKGKVSIVVYGLDGKALLQQEFTNQGTGTINKTVNLSKLPSGIYVVQVVVDGKYKKVQRVVKQ